MSGYVCLECGLEYDSITPSDAKVAIRSFPRRFRAALAAAMEDESDEGLVRRRPEPAVWSALEYTMHVAEMLDAMAGIVRAMRIGADTAPHVWDPDERAAAGQYNEQDPVAALDLLANGAERFAAEVEQVAPEEWSATAAFPWGERDLLTMMRNGVHEGSHHLRDVERVLERARAKR
ncbi:MAG TPA: DinB family protein [Acidimicrobiales bacterium]